MTTGTPGAKKIRSENQEPILKLARDIEILQNKSGAFTKAQIQGYYDTINESKKLLIIQMKNLETSLKIILN